MSTIINNECWYSGKDAAEKSEYIDSQKRYLSQGLSRIGIMFNQQLTISITGHLDFLLVTRLRVECRIKFSMRREKKNSGIQNIVERI